MSEAKISSAEFQAMLANYVRDPSQPAPPGMPPERLAVYTERMKKKNWQSKWPPLEIRFPK